MMLFIGDLVAPVDDVIRLACGSGIYTQAVVTCTNPFMLVSEEGDMRWSATVSPEDFKAIGYADPETLKICIDRMNRDLMREAGNEQST